ncbi:MAG: NAD(P)-dependent glycerol-3-phosphate dehydrogenase [Nitrospirae bacterium]|nr:NAD(P)-dependent glycerol-3-phosphate dehydrogenase [Nitrospirota bacterium]
MSYIAVIGGGSWGTTLTILLAEKDYDTALWVYEEDIAFEIKRTRINSIYLPDAVLPESVVVSSKLSDVLRNARYIVCVVPTQHIRPVFASALPYIPEDAIIVSASKGIEKGTNLTPSQILKELTGRNVSVLSGPSFAKEAIKRLPTAVTLASEDYGVGLLLQELFTTGSFRVYTHHDVIGVELGGALKNVIAIASGISDGLGLGYNARAALITRGLAEITRLGVMMGAKENTFSGLSGLGDLVLTCTGPISRNYTVGCNLAKGEKLHDIISRTKSIAEGIDTTKSAYDLARIYNIEMPIVQEVYQVLYEGKDPKDAVHELMNRSLKPEFYV